MNKRYSVTLPAKSSSIMKRNSMKQLIVIIFSMLPSVCFANYYCHGKVQHLGMSDSLHMSNGFGIHLICNFNEPKCNAWMSALMAAKMSDKTVTVYYSSSSSASGDQGNGLCQEIGHWVSPDDPVYYVQLN